VSTYTVQPGDTLAAVGRRVGISWTDLAALNEIQYPYTIYVGQEIKLPPGEASETPKRGRKKTPIPEAPLTRGIYSLWLPFVHHPPMPASAEEPGRPAGGKKQPQDAEVPETYVVQRGEYLIQLAERFGLDWRDLAERNELEWPWVIHPGQVLKVR
jgi:lipoprotein NlpD